MASPWDFYFEHLGREAYRRFFAWCQQELDYFDRAMHRTLLNSMARHYAPYDPPPMRGDITDGLYLHLFTDDEFGDRDGN